MQRHLLAVAAFVTIAASVTAGETAWKYVADDAFRPLFRTISLSAAKPEDLREDIVYRGKVRKYAQIRYGSESSKRVVVVIDEVTADDWDLYVDADRNRVIEAKDKVAGKGRERSGLLQAEIVHGSESVLCERRVAWRLSAARASIGVATIGYVAGNVPIDGKRIAVRLVDGDANGLFADGADRVWLDLDGNGKWDPITEQFPRLPVLTLGSKRYSVRGNSIGNKLAVDPLTAEGRIRVRLGALGKDVAVVRADVMLVGEDGIAIALTSLDTPVVVPAGKYALGAVSLSVQNADAAVPTCFTFSRTGLDDTVRWHELKKDAELVLDPIGKLRFDVAIDKAKTTPRSGTTINVQPQLFTADNLLINSCTRGEGETWHGGDGHSASVKLLDASKQVLAVERSGFH
jgi:hypothetical protein